jgi:molecular chaperone DnaJ
LRVKTPHGEVPITIQPGTEHGQQLRVFGKGVPDINLGLGDLIIKVSLKIPKNVTQEEKTVLEKLKESNNFTA